MTRNKSWLYVSYHQLHGTIPFSLSTTSLKQTLISTRSSGEFFKEGNPESLPISRRFDALILDEVKIKEGLVYNKNSIEIIGFTHLGDINDELTKLEQDGDYLPVATNVLALMVRGLLFKLEFPYAHFATRSVTADAIFPIMWKQFGFLKVPL